MNRFGLCSFPVRSQCREPESRWARCRRPRGWRAHSLATKTDAGLRARCGERARVRESRSRVLRVALKLASDWLLVRRSVALPARTPTRVRHRLPIRKSAAWGAGSRIVVNPTPTRSVPPAPSDLQVLDSEA